MCSRMPCQQVSKDLGDDHPAPGGDYEGIGAFATT